MELSNLALNLRGPWMISPEQAAAMAPVLQGVLRGYITEFDKAPEPYSAKLDAYIDAPDGDFAGKSIYVTYLTGTMLKYDSCGQPGARTIARRLQEADANPEIIGHIIITESGGGSANAVDELAPAISSLTKPVVAWIDGCAASAAIYAISYCDRIIAHNAMDLVGCIGTMMEISGFAKYQKDTDGYVRARIYADTAADKNGAYEAALEGNFHLIREERLNPRNAKFIADMKANRPAATDDQLTGKDYYAKDVVGTLIDAIGSFDDAVAAVMDLAEARQAAGAAQQAAATETHTINDMEQQNNYPTLIAMPAFEGQVFDADGSTHLQPNQLAAVETALAGASGLQSTNTRLQADLDEARQTIAQRDARITELENSLNAAIERASSGAPAAPAPDHSPAGGAQTIAPAETFDDALAACQEFLEK